MPLVNPIAIMSSPNDIPGYGHYIERPPISSSLRVETARGKDKAHPSAFQKDYPSIKSGMADHKLKHQLAKKVKRKGPATNGTLDDGSDLTDLALDTGEPMSGEERFVAQMYLDGNDEAGEYWI